MKSPRSIPVMIIAGLSVFLVLPIAFAAHAASQAVSINMPTFHSQVAAQAVVLTPISARKAQAIHEFKLAQI